MKVIVGLGNPGPRYDGTRHNVGFAVVDMLAAGPGVAPWRRRFQAQVAEMIDGIETILLVKPETFMNLSGGSVRQVVDFYKVPIEALLVVCDDMALPLGKLRVRASGSHGGHNGLRSIQDHLGDAYHRLRVGVDSPGDDAVDHVLGRFRPSERAAIVSAVGLAAEAALVWSRDGVAACMNKYNGPPAREKKGNDAAKKRRNKDQEPPTEPGDASSNV